jgi:hypothetical protein
MTDHEPKPPQWTVANLAEFEKIDLTASTAAAEAQRAAMRGLGVDKDKARSDEEIELEKLFHTTVTSSAVAAIDRVRDSAKFVQIAASAILAIYTGMLGLVYSTTSRPLPFRGMFTGVFLAASIALATAYLGFLEKPRSPNFTIDDRGDTQRQYSRTAWLTRWVGATVYQRQWTLRAAVACLFSGVVFIAAPFLGVTQVPDEPAAVTPPTVPAQVAAGFEQQAHDLYAEELADYRTATTARDSVIEQRQQKLRDEARNEKAANSFSLLAFVLLVGFVLLLAPPRREAA